MSWLRAECPTIEKTRTGRVATGGGSEWSWDYAPLEEIQRVVDPILQRHGLSYRFSQDDTAHDQTTVTVTLAHVRGHEVPSSVTIRKGSANRKMSEGQQDAGTLTLAMRKVLSMALGIRTSGTETPPVPTPDAVSDEEAATLQDYVDQLDDAGARAFLNAYQIEKPAQLPAHKFAGAVAQLKKRTGK